MKYICLQTWSPLRKDANSTAEMVTSLLFGETCTHVLEKEDWLLVRCDYDGYEGWVPRNYLDEMEPGHGAWSRVLNNHSAFFTDGISKLHISLGSNLPPEDKCILNGHEFYLNIRDPRKQDQLWEIARGFLFVPYLWGGRSDCGIDCSGLVQVVFKAKGIYMPRDAWQQEQVGELVPWMEREPNDLVYFEKNRRITHVGVISPGDHIIHASGRVREDSLIKDGIKNNLGNLTHSLASIRRVIPAR